MPSFRFRSSFRRQRPVGRWWTVLCALAMALVAPRSAFAAAPMCDPSGASAIAPIPAPPASDGELSAPKACSSHDALQVGQSRDGSPLVERTPDVPERIAVAVPKLPRIAGRLLACPDTVAFP